MQLYTIIFIAVSAVHVSGGFSAHHQELNLYVQNQVYVKLIVYYCIRLHLVGYTKRNTLTMHGTMNVKFEAILFVVSGTG